MERELVESYFESNGFLVKETASSRDGLSSKKEKRLPSMAIFNPLTQGNDTNLGFRLFTSDLSNIRSALVSLLGWESTSFSNSSSPAMPGFSSISSKRQRTIGWLNP